jgi:hypothetical protein
MSVDTSFNITHTTIEFLVNKHTRIKLTTYESGTQKRIIIVIIIITLQSQYYTGICINHIMDLVILKPNCMLNKEIRKTWNKIHIWIMKSVKERQF